MKIFKSMSIAVIGLSAGVSLAVADGFMDDAETVRAAGGVGNFYFPYDKDARTAETERDAADHADATEPKETVTDADSGRDEPVAISGEDSIDLGASSAGRAH